MRVKFFDVFSMHADGRFSPRVMLRIGDALVAPTATLADEDAIGDYAVAALIGHDLEVDLYHGSYVVKGIY